MGQTLAEIAGSRESPLALHCVICGTPLGGPVSFLFRAFGIERSSRNPNLCSRCNTHVAEGEVKNLTVLFADLSGFTELTGVVSSDRAYALVDAFLQMSASVLVRHGAYIDKYVGDAVMALFNAPIVLEDHAARAVAASVEIHDGCHALEERFQHSVRARIGIAAGSAHIGRLGSGDARDVTAIGQSVNLAARLQAAACPGETVLAQEIYEQVGSILPEIATESVTLKGFPDLIRVHRLLPGTTVRKGWHGKVSHSDRSHDAYTVGPFLFALLGAPCATAAFLGNTAVALGLGSLFGAGGAAWLFDDWRIRYPLAIFATLGTLANLYALWHARRVRAGFLAHGRPLTPTAQERLRNFMVIGAAILTAGTIALEWLSHHVIMHHPWP